MSKGPGTTMRRAAAALTAEPRPVWLIACHVFAPGREDYSPTRAQEESVRRALKRLAAKGEVVLGKHHWPVQTSTGELINRLMLTARLPVDAIATSAADLAAARAIYDFALAGLGAPDELLRQLAAGVWKPAGTSGCDPDRVRELLPLVTEEGDPDPDSAHDRMVAAIRGEAPGCPTG